MNKKGKAGGKAKHGWMGQGECEEGREDVRKGGMNEDKEQDVVNEGGAGERDGMKVLQEDWRVGYGGQWRSTGRRDGRWWVTKDNKEG